MTDGLAGFVERSLRRPVPAFVRSVGAELARGGGVRGVLFYGSNLRTGSDAGVLDFYVLTEGPPERGLWPRVGYAEHPHPGGPLRTKIAWMRLSTFGRAAAGRTLDTTIWARFAQPAALVWSADAGAEREVVAAVAEAAMTAGRFAAALGPASGRADEYWRALFRATYAAEFRVETGARGDAIVEHDADRLAALLPLAWAAGRIAFSSDQGSLRPELAAGDRARTLGRWRRCRRAGKPLNVARLVRAAFTFDGATRYAAWKIERHTGVPVRVTPWRERHPVLAAPGILWRVWRGIRPA